jgi:hypothetical protein
MKVAITIVRIQTSKVNTTETNLLAAELRYTLIFVMADYKALLNVLG